MRDVRTQLLPMQEGEIWRVQIVWPNVLLLSFIKSDRN